MEPNSVISDYYRLRLTDALRGRLELSANQVRNEAAKPVVFADVLTLQNVGRQTVPSSIKEMLNWLEQNKE